MKRKTSSRGSDVESIGPRYSIESVDYRKILEVEKGAGGNDCSTKADKSVRALSSPQNVSTRCGAV